MLTQYLIKSNYMIRITNYGHACYKFSNEKLSLVIDPYNDISGLKMPEVSANYVFCSHNHFDHNATEHVELIPTEYEINIGTIEVPHDHHGGTKRGMNLIHIFSLGNMKIAHFGDIGCVPNEEVLEQLKNLDIVLLPINGFYTISALEALEIVKKIQPKLVIPMHYYRKEKDLGLKDDNQIDIFKNLIEYEEIDEITITISSKTPTKPCLIFKNSEGDLR